MKFSQKKALYFFILFLITFGMLSTCKKSNTTSNPKLNNCTVTNADAENLQIFPADNPWNQDISKSVLDPNNNQVISALTNMSIKADFGSGLWQGVPIGIPYTVVCEQTMNKVTFVDYADQSDIGPYPIPLNAPIEGNGAGDSHVIAVDCKNQKLYELFNARVKNGQWEASCGAIFDLTSNTLRPDSWTSADAAGLPIFPGLVRYEEIVKGVIDHPIRFTLQSGNVQPGIHINPARHDVNSTGGVNNTLPFGARIRLKSNYDISNFSPTNQIILKAMKKYGLILADIGGNLYITGAPDERWSNDDLQKLGNVKGVNFEVVNFH